MKTEALFTDATAGYLIPPEPKENETVKMRFRVGKADVRSVQLIIGAGTVIEMEKVESKELFDYYEASYTLNWRTIEYHFFITGKDGNSCYYNQTGVSGENIEKYDFRLAPSFSTPEWAKGAVMYQIFVDRFYNGDVTNDVEDREYAYIEDVSSKVTQWDKYPAAMGVREFYGGDLQGIIDKLDYLEELGVEVLYLNPIFVSPSNHKYDIQDYDYVDPHYGKIIEDSGETLQEGELDNKKATKYQMRTGNLNNLEASNKLFIELVEKLHERGMKIILDGVFNHCGSFNKWIDKERLYENQEGYEKGAYITKESPYHKFFRFKDESAWPYNESYDGWWGHNTLPKLNYEGSPELEEYILKIAKKWISPPYNVDGWRLDVAADLGHSSSYNHEFWRKFRKAVKDVNPEAIILAEHYGDPEEWLLGDEWDTVMNYDAFMEPITWFLTGMEKHSDEVKQELYGNADYFIGTMKHHMSNMMNSSQEVAMNELSNHDHSRFLTRTNRIVGRVVQLGAVAANTYINEAVMREAVVFQMTWVGAPTIYYGDEAGVCGFTDPDSRRSYPWGKENQQLLTFHKDIIKIHKRHKVLKRGSLKILFCDSHILAYGRFDKQEKIVVILNNRAENVKVKLPVWLLEIELQGKMERLLYSYEKAYTVEKEVYFVVDGELEVNMGKHSAIILHFMK